MTTPKNRNGYIYMNRQIAKALGPTQAKMEILPLKGLLPRSYIFLAHCFHKPSTTETHCSPSNNDFQPFRNHEMAKKKKSIHPTPPKSLFVTASPPSTTSSRRLYSRMTNDPGQIWKMPNTNVSCVKKQEKRYSGALVQPSHVTSEQIAIFK